MIACRKKSGNAFPKNFASKLLGHKGMQGSMRMVAVLLLATMAAALAGVQGLAFPVAQADSFPLSLPLHLHPAGCHSQESSAPKTPVSPLPTSYQCCANGHDVAVPNASFSVRCMAAQLCSLVSVDEPRLNFAFSLRWERLPAPSNSPPSGVPLRI
jgi:hypothetical protein